MAESGRCAGAECMHEYIHNLFILHAVSYFIHLNLAYMNTYILYISVIRLSSPRLKQSHSSPIQFSFLCNEHPIREHSLQFANIHSLLFPGGVISFSSKGREAVFAPSTS